METTEDAVLGTFQQAYLRLRLQAARMGASYVHITEDTPPHEEGGCRINEYVLAGDAYRDSRGTPPGTYPPDNSGLVIVVPIQHARPEPAPRALLNMELQRGPRGDRLVRRPRPPPPPPEGQPVDSAAQAEADRLADEARRALLGGDRERAVQLLRDATIQHLAHLRMVVYAGRVFDDTLRAEGERSRLLDILVTLALDDESFGDLAARFLLLRRGLGQTTQAEVLRSMRGGPTELRASVEELAVLRAGYTKLLREGASMEALRAARAPITELFRGMAYRSDHEVLASGERVHALRAARSLDVVRIGVQRQLGPREALVEFVAFAPADVRSGAGGEERLAAFVLRPSGLPRWVDLGPKAGLSALITAHHRALRVPGPTRGLRVDATPGRGAAWRRIGERLHDALFAPLRAALGPARRLLLVPDGPVHRVAFDALVHRTGQEDGEWSFLLEDGFSFSRLASGRELGPQAPRQAPSPPLVMAPFGDPSLPAASRGVSLRLPSTTDEADSVAALLGVQALVGRGVPPERLGSRSSPRVLHLATHGWAVTRPEIRGTEDLSHVTGLAFAPAPSDPPDLAHVRVVSASQLELLDLAGTDLVVLSACSTNLGPIREGEGIFSVQRAFRLAGARAVVSSLWDVQDEATTELMLSFYRHYLDGASAPRALQQAMREMVAARRAAQRSLHPNGWAAFSVVGRF
ncbi:MAG: CHAT domain-containing protein [Sandaracinaceae bacterium]